MFGEDGQIPAVTFGKVGHVGRRWPDSGGHLRESWPSSAKMAIFKRAPWAEMTAFVESRSN